MRFPSSIHGFGAAGGEITTRRAAPRIHFWLFAVSLALLAARAAASTLSAREPQRSAVKLRGNEFSLELYPALGALPRLPDLSTPGETRIPQSAILRTAQPVLWNDRIVPPGEYELFLVVTEERTLLLGLESMGAGAGLRVLVERADYAEPSDDISVFLLAQSAGKRERGALQIRWGSLLLQGNFEPLTTTVVEEGELRLATYEFPERLQGAEQVFLGTIERIKGGGPSWAASLSLTGARPSLRLDDRELSGLVAEQRSLRRRIAFLKEAARTEPASHAAADAKLLEARLQSIDRRLEDFNAASATLEIPGERLDQNPASLALTLTHTGEQHQLTVSTRQGTLLFRLP
ncbi:MAG: hypothetical protein L0Z55_00725 [Planctomycetes bacterium]|nr:hypothetical protein [Planctomycetota bacterium]